MADSIKLTLSAHHQGKAPGAQITADAAEAKRLISGGIAVPSTVSDAKSVDVDPDTAATKR